MVLVFFFHFSFSHLPMKCFLFSIRGIYNNFLEIVVMVRFSLIYDYEIKLLVMILADNTFPDSE